ncbi:Metallo-dependent phosphatase [Anaeromyces robustus]|jgi:2',3'-cyclic-nucleotide 2'-phosphodiesterase (5'-nucleotidase family)|uniref:Metallo-dependent phosphatase n=1 Tax=Anaeromyces robustus TaxID=1754192 RepID=A0A1Y1VS58_9FUNG|nr:Metallo-dependent phosphatase [Anaeromyces robustus]|eukprot:ORX64118.1 Metallo-dependent phosphatase [Anaeromyces robustus]
MKNLIVYLTFFVTFLNIQCFGKTPDNDIIILYTNDVHCAVDSNIGYAGLSYYKQQMKEITPYVALVDAGDHVQGELFGSLSLGSYIMEVMNAVNYDVVVPGNHEFDYGMDRFSYFTKALNCGYTACNFRNTITDELILKPYRMIEYGDVKVAYVGISTPESITKSTPTYFMDANGNFIYDFDGDKSGEKLVETIQQTVDKARNEGADYVIAIGHLGENGSVTKVWSSPYIIERTNGIDAFIDGHTHEFTPKLMVKNKDGKEVPITQSGTKLAYIGKVTIGKDGNINTELVGPEMVESKDAKITEIIETIKNSGFSEKLGEIIGHTEFPLTNYEDEEWVIRKKETNIANLITDAYFEASKKYGGVDIVLTNAGSIRNNMTNEYITYGDAANVLPFPNLSCIGEVPGQSILDALEMGSRLAPESNGGFLHCAGITYAIDITIKNSVVIDERNIFVKVDGPRRVHSVYVNGEPLDPERIYRVYADNYILVENGDGMVFKDVNVLNYGFGIPSELLISYIRDLKEIPEKYRYPQGRIIYATINDDDNNNDNEPTESIDDEPTESINNEPIDEPTEPINNEPINNEPIDEPTESIEPKPGSEPEPVNNGSSSEVDVDIEDSNDEPQEVEEDSDNNEVLEIEEDSENNEVLEVEEDSDDNKEEPLKDDEDSN